MAQLRLGCTFAGRLGRGTMQSDTENQRDTRPQAAVDVTIVAHDIGSVGGMERQLTELLLGLRRLGHNVTVIARTCDLPPQAGVVFHRVRAPGRPFLLAYPWFMVSGTLAVRRWRRGVVQATGAIVLNRVDAIAVHYCHQVGPANPSRSTRLFRGHVRAAGVLKRLGERLCFRVAHAAAFVCVSDGVADELRTCFPSLAARVLTIHNGIDTDAFGPGRRAEQARALRSSLEIPEQALVAAFVGSEWERKGLEPAIGALAGAPEWTLVVAGGGDRARYQAQADALGVGSRVHFLGVSSDVQLIYQMSDAFLLPSSYETFSLVTFEAAASGLAILAAAVSGVRELIEDGRNGMLIERDPQEIARRLRQLAAEPALRASLGVAARESALRFSSARMVAEHHELYERLAARSRR
jgi:glycosyltransferase involved in cell wall biosynthesis